MAFRWSDLLTNVIVNIGVVLLCLLIFNVLRNLSLFSKFYHAKRHLSLPFRCGVVAFCMPSLLALRRGCSNVMLFRLLVKLAAQPAGNVHSRSCRTSMPPTACARSRVVAQDLVLAVHERFVISSLGLDRLLTCNGMHACLRNPSCRFVFSDPACARVRLMAQIRYLSIRHSRDVCQLLLLYRLKCPASWLCRAASLLA